jgi:hypothetical protein
VRVGEQKKGVGNMMPEGQGHLIRALHIKKEFHMPRMPKLRFIAAVCAFAALPWMSASLTFAQDGVPGDAAQAPPDGWAPELGQLTGHPLEPALDRAYKAMRHIERGIKDYTCTLVKKERVDGKLTEYEYMFTKVRHEPFSVYMYFLKPEDKAGREVIYVAGQNDGNLVAHEAKGIKALVGAVQLKPNSPMAMQGNRYPITEVGILNLTRRLIEVGESDRKYGECDVEYIPNTKINGRPCTLIRVTHPTPRKNFRYHKAAIYIDDELNIPTRFEAYDWPKQAGGEPILLEEYTYVNIKLNPGLSDIDFDVRNPNYKFKK